MTDIAISVSNVSKCYSVYDDQRSRLLHAVWPSYVKGVQEVWALKDINFEVIRGESVAIIGRNGGGKSTLLEILTGTLTPTTGNVKVNGRVSALLELGSGFNPEYSGRENVILNGLLLGLTKEEILSRFDEIEAFAEIGAAIDRPVKTYSSGMMMRLAFAVQVLCDPDILIVDEALSVGDFFFQQKCLGHIVNLCKKGVSVLFVSHDLGTVRDLCSRAIYLSQGIMTFDGEVNAAIQHYLTDKNLPNEIENNLEIVDINENSGFAEKAWPNDPLWQTECIDGKKSQIIAVIFQDKDGKAVQALEMGACLKIKIWYRANESSSVHVSIAVKNRYDQLINCTNSCTLGAVMPARTGENVAICSIDLIMNIEAGQYSVMINLGLLGSMPNQGVVLDETPWLGPLRVNWNYSEVDAPFLGMFGLPASVNVEML